MQIKLTDTEGVETADAFLELVSDYGYLDLILFAAKYPGFREAQYDLVEAEVSVDLGEAAMDLFVEIAEKLRSA